MLQVVLWCLAGIVTLALLAVLAWLFHRLCLYLEDAGYLYYRKRGGGGGGNLAGVLTELDRFTNPSAEHVIEAQDHKMDEEKIDGD